MERSIILSNTNFTQFKKNINKKIILIYHSYKYILKKYTKFFL